MTGSQARSLAVVTAAALLSLAGGAVHASAQTADARQTPGVTLAAALERAVAANQTIAAARQLRAIGLGGVGVAAERPNPEISFEWSKETPRQAIGAALPIELGGKRQRRVDVANATVAVTDAEFAQLVAETRNDARRAYFDVVAADLRVQINDDLLALARRAREAANARVTSGDVPRSDLTQADLAVANSTNDLRAARGEAAAARAELNTLLGDAPESPLTLADTLTGGALPSAQEALALATQTNVELQMVDRQISESVAKAALAHAMQVPDLSVGGTFTYKAEPEFRYGWRFDTGLTLPVFTTHKAGVLVEQSTLVWLKAQKTAALSRITGAIAAALSRATAARDQLDAYQNTILPLALEAERQAQVAYDGGQIGLPALVQALQVARDSRQRGLQAGIDFQHALADLERAIGAPIK